MNRQSGGDEAKRIGLVGRLHLSICGLGGAGGSVPDLHKTFVLSAGKPFNCDACGANCNNNSQIELHMENLKKKD